MRRKDFSLSLNPKVFLPTGDEENFSSMGSIGGALNLVGEKTINRFHLLASLGALSSRDNQYVDVDHRQLLLAQLGISYDVTDEWKINLESYRNFPLVNDKLQDEGKYFLTGRHETHKYITTYFGAGVTGWGEIQRNTYSAFAGIKIHESSLVPQTIRTKAASPQKQTERPPEEIYFAHDKHELEEKEKEKLGDYAVFLSQPQNKIKVVILEGHASSVGKFNYNMTLSYKRAHAVREYLLRQGVPQKLLSIKAFGETAKQDQQEWKNRKVHFNIEQED